jgi:hypothetical protein
MKARIHVPARQRHSRGNKLGSEHSLEKAELVFRTSRIGAGSSAVHHQKE